MIATTHAGVKPTPIAEALATRYSVDLAALPWWEQILAQDGIAVEGGELEAAIYAAEEAALLRGEVW